MSDRFEGSTKKFFIDVKEGKDGKYIKISELNSVRKFELTYFFAQYRLHK